MDYSKITIDNAVGGWEVKFGKYKGKSYRWIFENDVDYAKWLVTILTSEAPRNYLIAML
jgi:hypothetical protein